MTPTRWLSTEEQRTWRAYIVGTRLLFSLFERDMQRNAGIPLTYYEILSMLSEAPNRSLGMGDLAATLQVSPSRISHAVSRLEDAGLVRRETCQGDRRVSFAVLTDAGWEKVVATAPVHVDSVRRHLFDPLSPEQARALGDISETLLRCLTEHDGSPEEDMALQA